MLFCMWPIKMSKIWSFSWPKWLIICPKLVFWWEFFISHDGSHMAVDGIMIFPLFDQILVKIFVSDWFGTQISLCLWTVPYMFHCQLKHSRFYSKTYFSWWFFTTWLLQGLYRASKGVQQGEKLKNWIFCNFLFFAPPGDSGCLT